MKFFALLLVLSVAIAVCSGYRRERYQYRRRYYSPAVYRRGYYGRRNYQVLPQSRSYSSHNSVNNYRRHAYGSGNRRIAFKKLVKTRAGEAQVWGKSNIVRMRRINHAAMITGRLNQGVRGYKHQNGYGRHNSYHNYNSYDIRRV